MALPHFDAFVLIVDDQQAHREIMKENIMKVGNVGFSEAETGDEAMTMLQGYTPDLIITDLQMPGIDGEELITLIREMPQLGNVPIIAASSLEGLDESLYDEKYKEVIKLGANDFVMKPIYSETFVGLIRKYIS
jgi:two-component system chemotaxis response regulator CheY